MAFWDRKIRKISDQPGIKRLSENTGPCEENEFVPRYQQKKINIFVSSTFRDMWAERDELTLRVFPALRKICEDRGIAWGEVDLRWGIPPEKSELGETLSICLQHIDKCRPYFIGMLGERYGWVDPDAPDKVKDNFPWLKDLSDKSITELEILHGVLNNPKMGAHAFFYFRDKAFLESETFKAAVLESDRPGFSESEDILKQKLSDLKDRIRVSGFPVRENYPDPITFGELVRKDLMQVIDSLAPPPKPLSDEERATSTLEREDKAHESFAASRFGVYIPRQEYFDRLNAHVAGSTPPLVVLGESGSGKSALLAHWAFQYRLRNPNDLVLVHFVGASSDSTDWAQMLRRFMGEFKRKFDITEEIPNRDDALMAAFRNWLSITALRARVVLVIDALNQLEDRNGAPDLVWLPPTIPENIRLIVSTLEGRSLDAIRKRELSVLEVEPLKVAERNALITCYLKKYQKELSPSIKQALATAPQCENPLFLRALLEEVRIHGVHENLPNQIRDYLSAKTVDTLYEMILARYERDYERDRPDQVKDAVSHIWAARKGLSKSELMDLLGADGKPLPLAYWAPLYLAMEHSLVEKDGLITFFHEYFRTAVEQRYLSTVELKRIAHRQLADYFVNQPDGIRRNEELPWQLAEAAEWDHLVALLTNPSFFMAAWDVRGYDIKRYWVQIEAGSLHRMADKYQPVIREPILFPSSVIELLSCLLYDTGHLNEAGTLGEYLIHTSKEMGNVNSLQRCLGNQANILCARGDLDTAMQLYKDQEQVCRKLENANDLSACLGNQANIVYTRGDIEDAMNLYKEQERICRELGNIDSLQVCLGNQAIILYARGDLDNAMELYKEQERICRELECVDSLQICLGNQALILKARGNLETAMKCYKEQERICRELGNVELLQRSLGSQAIILFDCGDLDGAMKLHKEKERICRQLGNIDSLQVCLSNQANIHYTRGDLVGAMKLHKETERICRQLGNLDSLQGCLGNQANILYSRGDLDGAMILHKETERICRQLGSLDSLQRCLGNQANIHLSRGDLDGAMKFYKEKERICRELGNNNSLQICLGNQAIILYNRSDFDGAMKLLKNQERICREHRYLDSLQGCLGGLANILFARGDDLDDSMELYKEQERICRELGNLDSLQGCFGNQANIYYARRDLAGAMCLYKEQEKICRELENVYALSISLINQTTILTELKRHKEALAAAEEAYHLASKHGYAPLVEKILPILKRIRNQN